MEHIHITYKEYNTYLKKPDQVSKEIIAGLELLDIDLRTAAKVLRMPEWLLKRRLSGRRFIGKELAKKMNRAFGFHLPMMTRGEGFLFEAPAMNDVMLQNEDDETRSAELYKTQCEIEARRKNYA